MHDFNTFVTKSLKNGENFEDMIQEYIRSELEKAINMLLKEELTGLLDYEKYDKSGYNTGNSRNGYYERKLQTVYGELHLEIPRDRNGEFESPVVPKYERRDTRTEELILKLFQTGLTNTEIAQIAESLYQKKYSRTTISNITKKVVANIEAFRNRKLKNDYAVIYLDATYVPLRRDTVRKEAVHIALGITMEGKKEMLGYAVAPTESAAIWEELLQDLLSRGVNQPLLFVTDGLTGIEDVIHQCFPLADVQRCLVHVMRNISHKVRVRDRKVVLNDFKKVHRQADRSQAEHVLNTFCEKWKKIYPKIVGQITDNPYLLTFYAYPEGIRKSLYSTNLIENFNKHLKRDLKAKIQFPSEESMEKFLVSRFEDYNFRLGDRVHRGFASVLFELNQVKERKYKNKDIQ